MWGLADKHDLRACAERRGGSSLPFLSCRVVMGETDRASYTVAVFVGPMGPPAAHVRVSQLTYWGG